MKRRLIKKSLISPKFDFSTVGNTRWDNEIFNNPDRFKTKIIYMSPDEYLKLTQSERYTTDDEKIKRYKQRILENNDCIPVPCLMWGTDIHPYDQGTVSEFHDGQHRVKALKELDVETIPVLEIWDNK